LATLVGPQIPHRAAALVGTTLVDSAMKTAPDIVFVEREPLDRGEPATGE
jgi:hypothetical protein